MNTIVYCILLTEYDHVSEYSPHTGIALLWADRIMATSPESVEGTFDFDQAVRMAHALGLHAVVMSSREYIAVWYEYHRDSIPEATTKLRYRKRMAERKTK